MDMSLLKEVLSQKLEQLKIEKQQEKPTEKILNLILF